MEHFDDYEEAKKHLEKIIELNPKNATAHSNLGLLLQDYYHEYY